MRKTIIFLFIYLLSVSIFTFGETGIIPADTTAPSFEFMETPLEVSSSSFMIKMFYSDTDSLPNLDSFVVLFNYKDISGLFSVNPWNEFSGSLSAQVTLRKGVNYIKALIFDKAGNRTVIEREVLYTPDPILLDIISPSDMEISGKKEITVSGTVGGDNIVSVLVNGTEAYSGNGQYSSDIILQYEGFNKFYVSATDKAGQTVKIWRKVLLDTTPPLIKIWGVEDQGLYPAYAYIGFYVFDGALAGYSATLDGRPTFKGEKVTAPGTHVLHIEAHDVVGNISVAERTFYIGSGDISVGIQGVSTNSYYNHSVTPVISITGEGIASREISLNGQPFESGSAIDEEGEYRLTVTVTDSSGRTIQESLWFVIDKTAPRVVVEGFTDGRYYNTSVIPSVLINEEYPDSSTVTVDGDAFVSGSVISVEGRHVLLVSASDLAGNIYSGEFSFYVDTTPPLITIGAVSDGERYNSDRTPLIGISEENPLRHTITLNGTPFSYGTTITDEGVYTLRVIAEDRANNLSEAVIRFVIDKTAPGIIIEGVRNDGYYSGDVIPSIYLNDPEASITSATLNGAVFVSGTPVSQEGSYSLVLEAEDQAGNRAEARISFVLDRTAPVLALVSAAGKTLNGSGEAVYTNQRRIEVTGTLSDLNPASVLVNGVPVSLNGENFSAPNIFLNEGENLILFRGEDKAQNRCELLLTVFLDLASPAVTISYPGDGSFINSDVVPVIQVDDSSESSLLMTLNDEPWPAGTPITGEGAYTLKVTVTDAAGNVSVKSAGFMIDKTPPSVYEMVPASGSSVKSSPVTLSFSVRDLGSGVEQFLCNGIPGTLTGTANDGRYSVSLALLPGDNKPAIEIRDRAGNLFVNSGYTIVYSENHAPAANAGGPYTADVNVPVFFSGLGSSDPDGDALSFSWDFGDGSSATGARPSHAYASVGNYTVSLTVSDNYGGTAAAAASVTVRALNHPPSADAGGPYSGATGEWIAFDGGLSSDPDGDTLSFEWSFGDGTTAEGSSPSHAYNSAGVYTVTLTVRDPRGGSGTAVTQTIISQPNNLPIASPGGPYDAFINSPVIFDGSGSVDPDGDLLTYSWSFGDGAMATGPRPSHNFSSEGVFTVSLTVDDGKGGRSTASTSATIRYKPNEAPQADAGGPYTGEQGQVIVLDGGLSSDPDGNPLVYEWFIDGVPLGSDSLFPLFLEREGSFEIRLTVSDGKGLSDSAVTSLTVSAPQDRMPPVVNLSVPGEVLPGSRVRISANVTDDTGVEKVFFYVNSNFSGSVSVEPYAVYVDIPSSLSLGTQIQVRAEAVDPAGNRGIDQKIMTTTASPDMTPPSVSLNAPAEAVAGSSVYLSAEASDNVGIASVLFMVNGTSIGEVTAPPYFINYTLPDDAVDGDIYYVIARAKDVNGLSGEARKGIRVITDTDTQPPVITFHVPGEVAGGQVLLLAPSVTDNKGVGLVRFFVNDRLIGSDTSAPYELSWSVPQEALEGSRITFKVQAFDYSGLEAYVSQVAVVRSVDMAFGMISGEVYDDSTGLPLQDVRVRLSGLDASGNPYSQETFSDERGQYSLSASPGSGILLLEKISQDESWSRVERSVSLESGKVSLPIDARLTPYRSAPVAIGFSGGRVENDKVSSLFPAGALSGLTDVSAEVVSFQGLQGLLPRGWSPLAAFELLPSGTLFRQPVSVEVAPFISLPDNIEELNLQAFLAFRDSKSHQWVAVEECSFSGGTLSGSVRSSGQFVWVVRDISPLTPDAPAAGQPLTAAQGSDLLPEDAAAVIVPSPQVIFFRSGASSVVSESLSLSQSVSSGLILWSRISESYQFYGASPLSIPSYTADIVFFKNPFEENLSVLDATFKVSSSVNIDPVILEQGSIKVILQIPSVDDTSVKIIGSTGGTLSGNSGESALVYSGSLSSGTVLALNPFDPSAASLELPSGALAFGGIGFNFSHKLLNRSAEYSVPCPPEISGDKQILLVRVVEFPTDVPEIGGSHLVLTGLGKKVGERVVSQTRLPGSGTELPGIREEGRYLFVEVDPVGFVHGLVLDKDNETVAGAALFDEDQALFALSGSGGFVAAVPAGAFTLKGVKGFSSGSVTAEISSTGGELAFDLRLIPQLFYVSSTFPHDGTLNVPLSMAPEVLFSKPLDPDIALRGGNVGLYGPGGTIPGRLTLSDNNRKVRFWPLEELSPNTLYTFAVSEDITASSGESLDSRYVIQFTSLNTIPPEPPPAGSITVSLPNPAGLVLISASQGTVGLGNDVFIINTSTGTLTPAVVDPDGGFDVFVDARIEDLLQIRIVDSTGNETLANLPLCSQVNEDGSVTSVVSPDGGVIAGPEGIEVKIKPGTFESNAMITVDNITEADFPIQLPDEVKETIQFAGALRLDFHGHTPRKYLDVAISARPEDKQTEDWMVALAADYEGEKVLQPVDTAKLLFGKVRTSSFPCPGITKPGEYVFCKAADISVIHGLATDILTLSLPVSMGATAFMMMPLMETVALYEELEATHRAFVPAFGGGVSLSQNANRMIIPSYNTPGVNQFGARFRVFNETIKAQHPDEYEPLEFETGFQLSFTVNGEADDSYEVFHKSPFGETEPIYSFTQEQVDPTILISFTPPVGIPSDTEYTIWNALNRDGIKTTAHENIEIEGKLSHIYEISYRYNDETRYVENFEKRTEHKRTVITINSNSLDYDSMSVVIDNLTDPSIINQEFTDLIRDINLYPVYGGKDDEFRVDMIITKDNGEEEVHTIVSPGSEYTLEPIDEKFSMSLVARVEPIAVGVPENWIDHFAVRERYRDQDGEYKNRLITIDQYEILNGGYYFDFNAVYGNALTLLIDYRDDVEELKNIELPTTELPFPMINMTVVDASQKDKMKNITVYKPPRNEPLYLGRLFDDTTKPRLTGDWWMTSENHDPSQPIILNFSEPMDPDSLMKIRLLDENDRGIKIDIRIANMNKTVYIYPLFPLKLGTTYRLDLSRVKDISYNSIVLPEDGFMYTLTTSEPEVESSTALADLTQSVYKINDLSVIRQNTSFIDPSTGERRSGERQLLFASTDQSYQGEHGPQFVTMDITDLEEPRILQEFPGPTIFSSVRSVALLEDLNLKLHDGSVFEGDLALAVGNNNPQYFGFMGMYDVTDPTNIYEISKKILNVVPDPIYNEYLWSGALQRPGYPVEIYNEVHPNRDRAVTFIASRTAGLRALDLGSLIPRPPARERKTGEYWIADSSDLKVCNNTVFATNYSENRLEVLNMNMQPINAVSLNDIPYQVVIRPGYIWDREGDNTEIDMRQADVAFVGGKRGISVVDLAAMQVNGFIPMPDNVKHMDIDPELRRIIVSTWNGSLYFVDISRVMGIYAMGSGFVFTFPPATPLTIPDDRIIWKYDGDKVRNFFYDEDSGLLYLATDSGIDVIRMKQLLFAPEYLEARVSIDPVNRDEEDIDRYSTVLSFEIRQKADVTVKIKEINNGQEIVRILPKYSPDGTGGEPFEDITLEAGQYSYYVPQKFYINPDSRYEFEIEARFLMSSEKIEGRFHVSWQYSDPFPRGNTFIQNVDIADGHITLMRQDVDIPNQGPQLQFVRTYSNLGIGLEYGHMGAGWNHNLGGSLVTNHLRDTAVIHGGEGNGITFNKSGGVYVPEIGEYNTLKYENNDTFRLRAKNGMVYIYERSPDSRPSPGLTVLSDEEKAMYERESVIYRLKRAEDARGNGLDLFYETNPPFRLIRTTDTGGRSLHFYYQDIPLKRNDGIVVSYDRLYKVEGDPNLDIKLLFTYDEYGNLITAEKRSQRLNTRYVETYEYSVDDAKDRNNLIAIKGPETVNYVKFEYYGPNNPIPGARMEHDEVEDFHHNLPVHEMVRRIISACNMPEQTVVSYDYNFTGTGGYNISTFTDAIGMVTLFHMERKYGLLKKKIVDVGGKNLEYNYVWTLERDPDSRLVEILEEEDPMGRKVVMTYDGRGNKESTAIPVANCLEITTYDESFNLPSWSRDAGGTVREMKLDDNTGNVLEEKTHFTGGAVVYKNVYDDVGSFKQLMVQRIDPRGFSTYYEDFDKYGNPQIIRQEKVIGGECQISYNRYDDLSRLVESKDNTGHWIEMEYNMLNQVTKTIRHTVHNPGVEEMDTPDSVVINSYSSGGLLLSVNNGRSIVKSTYNALNRKVLEEVEFSDELQGEVYYRTEIGYDSNGNVTMMKDPEGIIRTSEYYKVGWLKKNSVIKGPDEKITEQYTYYDSGLLETKTNLFGETTAYVYDDLYRVTEVHLPLAPYITKTSYDVMGNVLTETDSNGNTITKEYDELNRLKNVIAAEGHEIHYTYDIMGNPETETDTFSKLTTRYTGYDGLGRLLSKSVRTTGRGYWNNFDLSISYDDENHMVESTDARGTITQTYMNGHDQSIKSIQDVGGENVTIVTKYDETGNVRAVRDPKGITSITYHDAAGRLIRETDAEGHNTMHAYNGSNWLLSTTDRRGITTKYEYDLLGRKTKTILNESLTGDGDVVLETIVYNDEAHSVTMEDSLRKSATVFFDPLDREIKEVDPFGYSIEYTWDGINQRSIKDKRGYFTYFEYDNLNRIRIVEDALGQKQVYSYNDDHNYWTEVDKKGIVSRMYTDASGHVVRVERDSVMQEEKEYDSNGNLILVRDGEGHLTKYVYDKLNRPKRLIPGYGSEVEAFIDYSYDKNGNLLFTQSSRGTVSRTYDSLNRLKTITDPDGFFTEYRYDYEGNKTWEFDQNRNPTQYKYGELGELIKVTLPDGVEYTAGYDDNRNRISLRAPGPEAGTLILTEYDYDDLNRLISITHDVGGLNYSTSYSYDPDNNKIGELNPKGQSFTFVYDPINRLTLKRADDQEDVWNELSSVELIYDPNDNLERVKEIYGGTDAFSGRERVLGYDNHNRLVSETFPMLNGDSRSIAFGYYNNGLRREIRDNQDGVISYTYDHRNRLEELVDVFQGQRSWANYDYSDDNLIEKIAYSNGVTADFTYYDNGRMKTVKNSRSSDELSYYEYTYDPKGNRMSQVERNGGLNEFTRYDYDLQDRLTEVYYPPDSLSPSGSSILYTYDDAGNRIKETFYAGPDMVTSPVMETRDAAFNSVNQLLEIVVKDGTGVESERTGFVYDRKGNLLEKRESSLNQAGETRELYFYSVWDQMVESQKNGSVTGRYAYDSEGRRILKSSGSRVDQYLYDGTSLFQEYDNACNLVARYTYGDRLVKMSHAVEGDRYYSYDTLGSVTNLTRSSGSLAASYHLDVWGNYRFPSELNASANRFGYTGHIVDDETDLIYAKARYYDPEIGRFTSQDSVLGDFSNPPSLHRYGYVQNNPTFYTDPSGNIPFAVPFMIGAIAFGADLLAYYMSPEYSRYGFDAIAYTHAAGKGLFSAAMAVVTMSATSYVMNNWTTSAFVGQALGSGFSGFVTGSVTSLYEGKGLWKSLKQGTYYAIEGAVSGVLGEFFDKAVQKVFTGGFGTAVGSITDGFVSDIVTQALDRDYRRENGGFSFDRALQAGLMGWATSSAVRFAQAASGMRLKSYRDVGLNADTQVKKIQSIKDFNSEFADMDLVIGYRPLPPGADIVNRLLPSKTCSDKVIGKFKKYTSLPVIKYLLDGVRVSTPRNGGWLWTKYRLCVSDDDMNFMVNRKTGKPLTNEQILRFLDIFENNLGWRPKIGIHGDNHTGLWFKLDNGKPITAPYRILYENGRTVVMDSGGYTDDDGKYLDVLKKYIKDGSMRPVRKLRGMIAQDPEWKKGISPGSDEADEVYKRAGARFHARWSKFDKQYYPDKQYGPPGGH